VRWHKQHDYSLCGRVRRLERFCHLTDGEVLAMPFPLSLAQEVVAVENGFTDWWSLKAAADSIPVRMPINKDLRLADAVPVLLVRDVRRAASFYQQKLHFCVDFLHGDPPFYGSVSRDGARLHLRFVHDPNFAALAQQEESLIAAFIEVFNVKALFSEFERRGVDFAQPLVSQAWGGLDFQVRDPDGNRICFAEHQD
jgi:uncharacterized glyoxalase superfamily protein PhnB